MFKNKVDKPVVVITGANGWLGRSAITLLCERYGGEFKVYALTRNKSALRHFSQENLHIVTYDEIRDIEEPITGLIHTAFKTQSYITESNTTNYRTENLDILTWLTTFILEKSPSWAIAISSGAAQIYLDKLSSGEQLTPKDLYGELKVLEETILMDSSIPNVAIGRLWAASGRHMQNHNIYALGEFIECALKLEAISIKSNKPVYRRYVDAEDFLDVILNCAWTDSRTLLDSGGVLTTIEDLASLVAKEIAVQTGSKVDINIGLGDVTESNQNYYAETDRFNRAMERYGIVGHSLEQQIERTALAVRKRLEVTQK
jgi:nucleoside-diphosphate-sugar epimerase